MKKAKVQGDRVPPDKETREVQTHVQQKLRGERSRTPH